MVYTTYQFGKLPAHQLLPRLIQALKQTQLDSELLLDALNWQPCWLNNNNRPVIGLLPKVSWTIWPTNALASSISAEGTGKHFDKKSNRPLQVYKQLRTAKIARQTKTVHQTARSTYYESDYQQWLNELIAYTNAQDFSPQSLSQVASDNASNLLEVSAYQHGLMGFVGYDLSAQHLTTSSTTKLAEQPLAYMGHYDVFLLQGVDQVWQLHVQPDTETRVIQLVEHYLANIDLFISKSLDKSAAIAPLSLITCWNFKQYQTAFARTQQYLYQGDSYQINLTQKWVGTLPKGTDLINYLPRLFASTQAPLAGYLQLSNQVLDSVTFTYKATKPFNNESLVNPDPTFELLSCSPELFLTFYKDKFGHHQVVTQPIKGTRPRGETAEQDIQFKEALRNSEKDQAENVMIVDLLRNDLGKHARTGSVHVPTLFAIESFSNVHHMVSTVTATLKLNVHPLTVLFDSLPAGSITGAPKKRAVEIISELEGGARGAYCGTMGFMNFDGTGQWNVLIRTLQANSTEVNLWAGGGITVGSDCAAEYQECLDKVGNLIHSLKQ